MSKSIALFFIAIVACIGCEGAYDDMGMNGDSIGADSLTANRQDVPTIEYDRFAQEPALKDGDERAKIAAISNISTEAGQSAHDQIVEQIADEDYRLSEAEYDLFALPSLTCQPCGGDMGINTDSPITDLHVVGSSSSLGEIALAPGGGANNHSSFRLCEDQSCSYEMSIAYDGAANLLKVFGKSGSTTYGPHLTIARNNGNVDIPGGYLQLGPATLKGYVDNASFLELSVYHGVHLDSNTVKIRDNNSNEFVTFYNTTDIMRVRGTIEAEEIVVEANLADYVFKDGYDLKSLEDVESYIDTNNHLPDMPSAAHVDAHGVSLGDFNNLLLQKVEELTLHLIAQNKQMKSQNEMIKAQTRQLSELKNKVSFLEKK